MGEIYVTVNFVKVMLVRVVAAVVAASVCTLSVLTQKGVREEKKNLTGFPVICHNIFH